MNEEVLNTLHIFFFFNISCLMHKDTAKTKSNYTIMLLDKSYLDISSATKYILTQIVSIKPGVKILCEFY